MARVMRCVMQRFGMGQADAINYEHAEHQRKNRRCQTRSEGERNRSRSTCSSHNNLRVGPLRDNPLRFSALLPYDWQVSWLAGRKINAAFPVSQWLPSAFASGTDIDPRRSTVAGSAAVRPP